MDDERPDADPTGGGDAVTPFRGTPECAMSDEGLYGGAHADARGDSAAARRTAPVVEALFARWPRRSQHALPDDTGF